MVQVVRAARLQKHLLEGNVKGMRKRGKPRKFWIRGVRELIGPGGMQPSGRRLLWPTMTVDVHRGSATRQVTRYHVGIGRHNFCLGRQWCVRCLSTGVKKIQQKTYTAYINIHINIYIFVLFWFCFNISWIRLSAPLWHEGIFAS